MKTQWGNDLNADCPLAEYPRPQLVRESYISLNGAWDYAITGEDGLPEAFDGKITVPFSPECELSGVCRSLKPRDVLWYRRSFSLPEGFIRGRVLLHFDAVDQVATVYLNGREAATHEGGYTSFTVDITPFIEDLNELTLKVRDFTDKSYYARGKQKTKRGGIWYTPQSGIWQSVWLESVPSTYIERLTVTPLYDDSAVEITAELNDSSAALDVTARTGDIVAHGVTGTPVRMNLKGFVPWSPDDPHLYALSVSVGSDRVESYFGMRKFSVERDKNGVARLFLNNEPYFHNGVLDQGYWPDGLYTPPSDEAMLNDIASMKRMGFNTLRKHIKVEPMRWYYHCDRLGMLVWQDIPNGGSKYRASVITAPAFIAKALSDGSANYKRFGRENAEGRAQYCHELDETVLQLRNCVSIAMWVPFNEGWGQFDAAKAYNAIRALDATRTVDHASGWYDQGIGELQSLHVYLKPYKFAPDRLGRAVLLTEFGGYNRRIEAHSFNKRDFGYKRFKSDEELLAAFKRLYEEEIIPAKAEGLSAAIYTQLSDVEDELNGLLTYDRAIEKLPHDEVRKLMDALGR